MKQKNNAKKLIVILSSLTAVLLLIVVSLILYLAMRPTVSNENKSSSSYSTKVNEIKDPAEYRDYRKGGLNGEGIELNSIEDVDSLSIDDDLKQFLRGKVGKTIIRLNQLITLHPVVDRAQGKYAAVYGLDNGYSIIGPKDGNGPIDLVAGTQQIGMRCDDLIAAKVPSKLVDGVCYTTDSAEAKAYVQQ